VDAVWLSPFYRSPQADGGYDVADYRDVDPSYGTLRDVGALISRAHELGLWVIIDLVPNHTSSEHPWFRAARTAPPGSPERARFIFRNGRGVAGAGPPNDWPSGAEILCANVPIGDPALVPPDVTVWARFAAAPDGGWSDT
jgi:alpha-glucosidase